MFGKFNKSGSTVKVVDGKLILSFPQAVRPVLWHMNIAETKTCSFEVRENTGGTSFSLIIKNGNESAQEIAEFKDPGTATEALVSVSQALEKNRTYTPGQVQPVQLNGQGNGFLKFAGAITGIVILVFLINTLWSVSPRPPQSIKSATSPDLKTRPQENASEIVGAPVSADDFLTGR